MGQINNDPLLPDQVLAVREIVAMAQLAFDEQYTKRLDVLKKLKDDIEAERKIIGTAKTAEKMLADAEKAIAQAQAEARGIVTSAQDTVEKVKRKESSLREREKLIESKEQDLQVSIDTHKAAVAARESELNRRAGLIGEQEEANRKEALRLDSLSAALNTKDVDLQRRAEKLRSAAAEV